MGLFMATASVSTYVMGRILDAGVPARSGALGLGIAMLGPAMVWAISLRRSWGSGDRAVPDGLRIAQGR